MAEETVTIKIEYGECLLDSEEILTALLIGIRKQGLEQQVGKIEITTKSVLRKVTELFQALDNKKETETEESASEPTEQDEDRQSCYPEYLVLEALFGRTLHPVLGNISSWSDITWEEIASWLSDEDKVEVPQVLMPYVIGAKVLRLNLKDSQSSMVGRIWQDGAVSDVRSFPPIDHRGDTNQADLLRCLEDYCLEHEINIIMIPNLNQTHPSDIVEFIDRLRAGQDGIEGKIVLPDYTREEAQSMIEWDGPEGMESA